MCRLHVFMRMCAHFIFYKTVCLHAVPVPNLSCQQPSLLRQTQILICVFIWAHTIAQPKGNLVNNIIFSSSLSSFAPCTTTLLSPQIAKYHLNKVNII